MTDMKMRNRQPDELDVGWRGLRRRKGLRGRLISTFVFGASGGSDCVLIGCVPLWSASIRYHTFQKQATRGILRVKRYSIVSSKRFSILNRQSIKLRWKSRYPSWLFHRLRHSPMCLTDAASRRLYIREITMLSINRMLDKVQGPIFNPSCLDLRRRTVNPVHMEDPWRPTYRKQPVTTSVTMGFVSMGTWPGTMWSSLIHRRGNVYDQITPWTRERWVGDMEMVACTTNRMNASKETRWIHTRTTVTVTWSTSQPTVETSTRTW